jgi:hypothetical protein
VKLHFENPYTDDNMGFQKDAIEAVCDLFREKATCRTEFTIISMPGGRTTQASANPHASGRLGTSMTCSRRPGTEAKTMTTLQTLVTSLVVATPSSLAFVCSGTQ